MNRPHLLTTSTMGRQPDSRSVRPSLDGDNRPAGCDNDLLGQAGIMPPLVPDAEYVGVFLRAEKGRFERRERWFLWFAISTQGPHVGEELYLSCPIPDGKKSFGLGSKLIAAYAIATGAMPRRRDRITKSVFRNKLFRFRTRTVTKDKNGAVRPLADHYSVIERLLAVETGA
jgi:hypothetical protein